MRDGAFALQAGNIFSGRTAPARRNASTLISNFWIRDPGFEILTA
jgi:hypothetical protein